MREKKRNKGSSQGQAQAQLKEGAEERERYVGWGPAVPHSIQGHGEPPPHTDSGLQGRLCAGFLPTVEVSRDKDTDHFNTCGCMLPFIPSQPRGHLGTLLPLQTWTNLVMSNTVITQGKKCLLAAWEWVCPSVQRRQKKGKKAQSSRSGESGREQGSREKAALLTVPKVPTIHQQGISSPHDPELGNNCRPNQHDLQTHSHADPTSMICRHIPVQTQPAWSADTFPCSLTLRVPSWDPSFSLSSYTKTRSWKRTETHSKVTPLPDPGPHPNPASPNPRERGCNFLMI